MIRLHRDWRLIDKSIPFPFPLEEEAKPEEKKRRRVKRIIERLEEERIQVPEKEEKEEKPVVEPTSFESEEVHGGMEEEREVPEGMPAEEGEAVSGDMPTPSAAPSEIPSSELGGMDKDSLQEMADQLLQQAGDLVDNADKNSDNLSDRLSDLKQLGEEIDKGSIDNETEAKNELKDMMSDIRKKSGEASKQLSEAEGLADTLEDIKNELEKKGASKKEIKELEDKLDELAKKIDDVREKLKEKKEEIKSAKKHVEEQIEKMDESYGEKNYEEVMDIKKDVGYSRRIATKFVRLLQLLAEDFSDEYILEEEELFDPVQLMMRRYSKKSLYSCMLGIKKEKIVILVDTSGSCSDFFDMFEQIVKIAAEFKEIEVYTAPNGYIVKKIEYKRGEITEVDVEDQMGGGNWKFRNRVILFFGDFDGGDSVIIASWTNKVYWFSNEDRYDDTIDHGWCKLPLSKFKGKYLEVFSLDDVLKQAKQMLRLSSI